ncbi:hypothetical protein [Desulfolithobacter sp.]
MTPMITTSSELWTTSWLLVLFLLLVMVIFSLRRTVRKQHKEITRLETTLQETREKINRLETSRREQEEFIDTLASAEITTRLQKPRLALHQNGSAEPPEKYRYAASMVQNGMTIDEISSILGIARAEARQLVTLARMASRG